MHRSRPSPQGQRINLLVLSGWHLSLPWELSPTGIIRQRARSKCGHGCFSRHAFPRICVPGCTVWAVTAPRPHPHRHVLLFHVTLTTLCVETGDHFFFFFWDYCARICRNGSPRSVLRPPACRKQLQTAVALTIFASFMIF